MFLRSMAECLFEDLCEAVSLGGGSILVLGEARVRG